MHFICTHSFSRAPFDGNRVPVLAFRKYTLMNTSTIFYCMNTFTVHTAYKRYDRARTLRALFTLSRYRRNRINIIKINRKPGRRPRFGALISSWPVVTHNIVIMRLEIESSLVGTVRDPLIRDNYSHRKIT